MITSVDVVYNHNEAREPWVAAKSGNFQHPGSEKATSLSTRTRFWI